MTRKALRKKRQLEERRQLQRSRARRGSSSSWVTVGALVASAAIGIRPAAAAPRERPYAPSQVSPHVRVAFNTSSEFDDPRLALVAAVFGARQDPASAPAGDVRRFDIPPGPIGDVIIAFQRLTAVTVTLQIESIGSIQSPGATGAFSVEEALRALLTGTGVRFRLTSPTAAVFELDPLTESVDVTGQALVVASPKYTGPLRSIPQTIEIIPRAAMEQQGVTTLSEALRNVPGITMQAGEGGGASSTAGDMFNMRGFNAANSLFVDGVRDDGLISRDVFNIEQVEVFMGPTGSDVGRGTASGYVNMQTKVPRMPASSSGSVAVGSSSQLRTTIDINQPLSLRQDSGWLTKSAIRINGLWQDSGVPGRDLVELGTKAIAPSLALGVDTDTRVTVAGQVMRQDNIPDYGVPGAAWSEPLAPTTVLTPQPVNQANYYGTPAYDYDHGSQNSVVARVEHDVNPRLTVRNQTRYNGAHREAVVTTIQNPAAYNPATNLVTLARQGNDRENGILSNQTNLTDRFATRGLQHSASAGLEYTHERQLAPTLAGVGIRVPANIFTPNPNAPVLDYAVTATGAASEGWTDTVALYAFDTVDLSPRIQLSGGIRWEYYDTQFRANDAAGLTTTNEGASDSLVSGKAAVLFKVSNEGNVYLAYGSTVTPPGSANFTLSAQANNQNNPNVEPQESANIEAGSKWDVANGRLSLTGSVFHTVNKNVIFTVDATAVPPIYNQDDGQRVNGVTVGAAGRVLPQWQVLANFSYLDTALESQSAVNNGNRLTLTPMFSGSFWTSYELPRRVTIGGGLRTTSEVFINAANTIKSPGYHLVDALAEYEVNQHLSLRLNIYNLTNETYIRSVNNNGGRYNPGNPRSVLATTMVRF